MITLITGKPGSGKSLLAVEMILDNSKADTIRPCFSNIDGLDFKALKCFPLEEPDKWHTLPEGSLIVIDEVQDWMPPRASGKAVPEHVDMLNKHRHMGHDVILMTPDPMLLDVTARKTVGRHLHCYRPFGMEHRKVFEWNGCNDSPEPSKNESNALVKKKPFDKSLFGYYKSAEVHTHKPRIPWKKFGILFGAIALAVSLFAYAGTSIYKSGHDDVVANTEATLHEASESLVGNSESEVSVLESSSDAQIVDFNSGYSLPLAYYRGVVTARGIETILIELPSGHYVHLDQFQGFKLDNFTTLLYFDVNAEPAYRIEDPELANYLRG